MCSILKPLAFQCGQASTIPWTCISLHKIFAGCFLWAAVLGAHTTLGESILNSTIVLFDRVPFLAGPSQKIWSHSDKRPWSYECIKLFLSIYSQCLCMSQPASTPSLVPYGGFTSGNCSNISLTSFLSTHHVIKDLAHRHAGKSDVMASQKVLEENLLDAIFDDLSDATVTLIATMKSMPSWVCK